LTIHTYLIKVIPETRRLHLIIYAIVNKKKNTNNYHYWWC